MTLETDLRGAQDYLRAAKALGQACSADAAAWRRFYGNVDRLARRIALNCGVERQDVDDYVQEAWIEIARVLPNLKYDPDRSPLRIWLSILIRRKVNRRRQQANGLRCAVSGELPSVPCTAPEPLELLTDRERQRSLEAALEILRRRVSETTYQVFAGRCLENQSSQAVAQRLGLSPDQVWRRNHLAKQKLRSILSRRP